MANNVTIIFFYSLSMIYGMKYIIHIRWYMIFILYNYLIYLLLFQNDKFLLSFSFIY